MSVSLLSTKLRVPRLRANAVLRPRLTDTLLAGLQSPGRFALLSGPAGFGKTTLLSEFAARAHCPVAWLSLDSADNDPGRFWTYVIKALQSIQPNIGEAGLTLLETPQSLPDETIPTILINALAALESEFVLVLDDYHVIRNPAIHTGLAFLLEHIPDRFHLVLSTRVHPPWPLARFRWEKDSIVFCIHQRLAEHGHGRQMNSVTPMFEHVSRSLAHRFVQVFSDEYKSRRSLVNMRRRRTKLTEFKEIGGIMPN